MEITADYLAQLQDYIKDKHISTNEKGNYTFILPKESWLKWRDNKLCTYFTDEQLENAIKTNIKICTGKIYPYGYNVDFYVDRYCPIKHSKETK